MTAQAAPATEAATEKVQYRVIKLARVGSHPSAPGQCDDLV